MIIEEEKIRKLLYEMDQIFGVNENHCEHTQKKKKKCSQNTSQSIKTPFSF